MHQASGGTVCLRDPNATVCADSAAATSQVVKVDTVLNLIFIKGAVPGHDVRTHSALLRRCWR